MSCWMSRQKSGKRSRQVRPEVKTEVRLKARLEVLTSVKRGQVGDQDRDQVMG